MVFKNFLYSLKNKPENVRNGIMWLCVVFFMLIVGAVWIVTLKDQMAIEKQGSSSLKKTVNDLVEQATVKNSAELKSPIESFMDSLNKNTEEVESTTESASSVQVDIEKKDEKTEAVEKGYKLPIE